MATQEKTWNVANRLHSQKDSDNPEVNHIITGADEIYDDAKGAKQSDINAQADAAFADRYTKTETYSKEQLDSLITTPDVNYVSVVATNATTAATDILPATGEADTIYRVGNWDGSQYDSTMYALYAWNGSAYVCLAVRSFVGEVYDISVNHPDGQGNPTPYADLTAALGTDGANIPADIRRGGMRIQFIQGNVQSNDNKYVQYRLMANSWSTNTDDWAISDNGVYVKNPEFIRVYTISGNGIVWAIKANGDIFYGAGVPQQIKDYIEKKISSLPLDEYDDIVTFLSDYLGSDTTMKAMIDGINAQIATKVDKITGKSLIDAEYSAGISYIENPEFVAAYIEHGNNILFGIKTDGDVYFGYGVPNQIKDYVYTQIADIYNSLKDEVDDAVEEMQERVEEMLEDAEETLGYFESKDSPEWQNVTTDNQGRVIEGIKKDFTKRRYEKTFEKDLYAEKFGAENAETENLKITNNLELTDEIIRYILSNNINDGSVKALYPKYEWEGYLANLATTKNLGVQNDRTYKPLVLEHFSDIHNDAGNFKRVLDFYNMYKEYIADVLLSGDIAGNDWQGYSSRMTGLEGFYDVLKIIGNHDVYNYNNQSGVWATEAQCFERYMQGIENWGVHYTEGLPYWYKDYVHNTGTKDNFNGSAFDNTATYPQSSLVTYNNKYYKAKGNIAAGEFNPNEWEEITSFGIRLIGYNFMHPTSAQNAWVANTLADALTKGLSVIITTHGSPYLEDNTAVFFDTPFDGKEVHLKQENSSMTPWAVVIAVSNFIDNGGEFICYLCGHIHTDKCGYMKTGTITTTGGTTYTNNHKQVFIVIGLASGSGTVYDYDSGGQSEIDICKVKGTKTCDLFNIESFDTETKTISVLRVGCDIDRLLRSRRSMVIDYKNCELLYTR